MNAAATPCADTKAYFDHNANGYNWLQKKEKIAATGMNSELRLENDCLKTKNVERLPTLFSHHANYNTMRKMIFNSPSCF